MTLWRYVLRLSTLSPFHMFTFSPFHLLTFSSVHPFRPFTFHLFILPPSPLCHPVTFSPFRLFTFHLSPVSPLAFPLSTPLLSFAFRPLLLALSTPPTFQHSPFALHRSAFAFHLSPRTPRLKHASSMLYVHILRSRYCSLGPTPGSLNDPRHFGVAPPPFHPLTLHSSP